MAQEGDGGTAVWWGIARGDVRADVPVELPTRLSHREIDVLAVFTRTLPPEREFGCQYPYYGL